ncbi:MAG TPA: hypothetical protein VI958_11070, partial [Acidobacteriota bacterium]
MYVLIFLLSVAVIFPAIAAFQYRKRVQQLELKQKGPAAMIEDLNRKLADQKSQIEDANAIAARALQELDKQKQIARIAS